MSTPIRERAEQYLAMRRALGFKLTTFGARLFSFIDYLEAHDLNVITADAALAWAITPPRSTNEVHWSRRLMVARIFARHLAVLDPATEIPPPDMLPHHCCRVTPHLYSDTEIVALLNAADRLRPPLRALTWRALLCLLVVSGLRTGEACGLDVADVDFDGAVLSIRDSKFGKQRLVTVHPSTVTALRGYLQAREKLSPAPDTPALFVSTRGTRLDHTNIAHVFAGLVQNAGITTPAGQRRARLHDLRHTAATLMHESGEVTLRTLADMLGHADPAFTLRTYAHSSDDATTAASSTLATLFEADRGSV